MESQDITPEIVVLLKPSELTLQVLKKIQKKKRNIPLKMNMKFMSKDYLNLEGNEKPEKGLGLEMK